MCKKGWLAPAASRIRELEARVSFLEEVIEGLLSNWPDNEVKQFYEPRPDLTNDVTVRVEALRQAAMAVENRQR